MKGGTFDLAPFDQGLTGKIIMKVVSERPKKNWSKKFKCKNCERTLKVKLTDLYFVRLGEGEIGVTHTEVVFKCIICKRRNYIHYQIPEWVKMEVFRSKKTV